MRGLAILVIAAVIYSGARDAALAQTSSPNVVSPPPGSSTNFASSPIATSGACAWAAASSSEWETSWRSRS